MNSMWGEKVSTFHCEWGGRWDSRYIGCRK